MSKIFITGGTGSLGKALLAYYRDAAPDEEVTVYSRDEVKQSELKAQYPDVRFMLGDVRDYDRLLLAMRRHDVVIHTSAYKQVPSSEVNVDEAIATNVLGSLNVARAAVQSNVQNVVGVSTDKAVEPINAYGETKALMEKLFQQADTWSDTLFNCVRYGNVLGSRGSVVPLFKRQLAQGCVTITDPDMTRFWLTMDDAVNIVITAYTDAQVQDGAILVPQAPASDMLTLMWAVEQAFDLQVNCAPKIIGARPGEKKHERLVHDNESMHTLCPTTDFPYYQVLPATTGFCNKAPFRYDSNTARQLTAYELAEMVATCQE